MGILEAFFGRLEEYENDDNVFRLSGQSHTLSLAAITFVVSRGELVLEEHVLEHEDHALGELVHGDLELGKKWARSSWA